MMQRRNFIRLVGGGTVMAAAAGAGVAGWRRSAAYPAEAVQVWSGPGAEPDPRKRALSYAITAPNPHNRQPWLVDLRRADEVTLFCDRERLLPETDPFGRQILIGHGAFIELLVMALQAQGLRADVTLWPRGEFAYELADWDAKKPVALLRLAPGGVRDPLFAHVLRRHTAKTRYDLERPVPVESLQRLVASVPAGGAVRAGSIGDAAQLEALRTLCLDAAKVEMATPRTAMESLRLMRVGPDEILAHRDGISLNSPMVRILDALGQLDRTQAPPPGGTMFKQSVKRFEDHCLTAMGFVWLATGRNTRADQIAAGRAYVRQQLLATEIGIGMHPMSQPLQEFPEVAPHYDAVHRMLLGTPGPRGIDSPTLQMLCRVGFPDAAVEATPRRPLAGFVVA